MRADIRSNWRGTLIACAKCSRKLRGGFGPDGREPLAKAIRRASGGGRKRKAPLGVIEVKCLGLCPKRAVVLIDAAAPERWHLVPPGRDVDALLAELGHGQAVEEPTPSPGHDALAPTGDATLGSRVRGSIEG